MEDRRISKREVKEEEEEEEDGNNAERDDDRSEAGVNRESFLKAG